MGMTEADQFKEMLIRAADMLESGAPITETVDIDTRRMVEKIRYLDQIEDIRHAHGSPTVEVDWVTEI